MRAQFFHLAECIWYPSIKLGSKANKDMDMELEKYGKEILGGDDKLMDITKPREHNKEEKKETLRQGI